MASLNQNGQLILETLKQFNEPVTITRLVAHLAETVGIDPEIIKFSVQETLEGGVRYGFIQQANRKYFAQPMPMGFSMQEPLKNDANEAPEESAVNLNRSSIRRNFRSTTSRTRGRNLRGKGRARGRASRSSRF